MHTSINCALLLFVCLAVLSPAAAAREWKDSTGKFSVEAELVDLADGMVRLKKADGKVVTLPLARLARRDIVFARKQFATQQKVQQAVAKHNGDPAELFCALLDGGYAADVGKLPPIDNPIVRRIVGRVIGELRSGKYKPKAKDIPKLLEVLQATKLGNQVTIFPEAEIKHETLAAAVQQLTSAPAEFFDTRSGKVVPTDSARTAPLQWYSAKWLQLGVANNIIRVLRIKAE